MAEITPADVALGEDDDDAPTGHIEVLCVFTVETIVTLDTIHPEEALLFDETHDLFPTLPDECTVIGQVKTEIWHEEIHY